MSGRRDLLADILWRKRRELIRRRRREDWLDAWLAARALPAPPSIHALRRGDGPLRFIAEVKFQSPSAGCIRRRAPGEVARIARSYEAGGASAVSVLADGPAFGGSLLDVRRAAAAVRVPVLFKEFVLDPVQVRFARACGASLVLLLVRALDEGDLPALVSEVRAQGMEPVVEAADEAELERALATDATVVGVNARDLRSFDVDRDAARRCLERVPPDRVAVWMSGIVTADDLRHVTAGRADAVLIGEGLMRAPEPGIQLRTLADTL